VSPPSLKLLPLKAYALGCRCHGVVRCECNRQGSLVPDLTTTPGLHRASVSRTHYTDNVDICSTFKGGSFTSPTNITGLCFRQA
jgi:hypothetical protein